MQHHGWLKRQRAGEADDLLHAQWQRLLLSKFTFLHISFSILTFFFRRAI
jgi:hypothetical protein